MRYMDEDDLNAAADYEAEMAQQADYDDALSAIDADAPGFIPVTRSWSDMSYAEKARAEGFSCYEDGIPNAGCYD